MASKPAASALTAMFLIAPAVAPEPPAGEPTQLGLFPPTHDPLLRELAAVDTGAMTPLQALNLLAEWQQRLKGRR